MEKTTFVTPPSPETVESSNRVITTDSKAIEAKKPSTKNTDYASPVKLPSAVVTVAPKDDNKTTTISTQTISSTPVKDSPQSTETTNTTDEERQLSSLTPEYENVKVPEADITLS